MLEADGGDGGGGSDGRRGGGVVPHAEKNTAHAEKNIAPPTAHATSNFPFIRPDLG